MLVAHGAGLVTAYFHLSKFLVKQGEEVKRGQLLGLVEQDGSGDGAAPALRRPHRPAVGESQALLALPFPGATSPPAVFPLPRPVDGGVPDGGGVPDAGAPSDAGRTPAADAARDR